MLSSMDARRMLRAFWRFKDKDSSGSTDPTRVGAISGRNYGCACGNDSLVTHSNVKGANFLSWPGCGHYFSDPAELCCDRLPPSSRLHPRQDLEERNQQGYSRDCRPREGASL